MDPRFPSVFASGLPGTPQTGRQEDELNSSRSVAPRPLVRSLPFDKSKDGRIQVDPYLRGTPSPLSRRATRHSHLATVLNQKSVYALGDCAFINEKPLPCTAQAADQQAKYLAKTLNLEAENKEVEFPFVYLWACI